uniref:MFS transporter n=1 Tax=Halomonas sp. TaxID=1486246 RepID=UPI002621D75F|nr:MFS transporter [Halomonas sp.]
MAYECDQYPLPSPYSPPIGSTTCQASIREWLGLAVLALPTALLGLDVTILYLALPALAVELQPSSTQALWIMDAYGFMIAGFLITMGTLGDRIGRRRLLMIGTALFGMASVAAAYATSAEMLIVARALLGIAGATLMPSTLALISNLFGDARQRALAIGIWATMFALGMAAGPVLGGWLLSHFWWGSAFLVAVPIAAILLLAAPFLLPEYRATHGERLDLISVLLSLVAILSVIYGLKEIAKTGLETGLETVPVMAIILGIALGSIFVRRQGQLDNPLLDMRLFASRTFSSALIVLLLGLTTVAGVMLLVTQYLQLVAGLTPLKAGLWMGPPALMMVIAGITAPLVARRIRPGYVVSAALAFSTLGYLLLILVGTSPSGVWTAIAGFSLVYLALGTLAALGTELVIGTAPADKAGSASAMSEMVQELGIALGVALLGSLASVIYRLQVGIMTQVDDLPASSAALVQDSLWTAMSMSDQLPVQAVEGARQAFTTGLNVTAAVSGIAILALAVISAISLRHVPALNGNPG